MSDPGPCSRSELNSPPPTTYSRPNYKILPIPFPTCWSKQFITCLYWTYLTPIWVDVIFFFRGHERSPASGGRGMTFQEKKKGHFNFAGGALVPAESWVLGATTFSRELKSTVRGRWNWNFAYFGFRAQEEVSYWSQWSGNSWTAWMTSKVIYRGNYIKKIIFVPLRYHK